jgi:hypothetical protein
MDKKILKKQIKKGLSTRQIGKSLNKSQSSIKHWLNKYNLKTIQSFEKPHLCEDCGEDDPQNFYSRQKQKCKKCHNKRTAQDGKNKRIKGIELLGGSCQVCGYNKCSSALEFHHIDPTIKDVNYSTMRGWTFSRIKKELDNCILLCANCHREEHERLRQN